MTKMKCVVARDVVRLAICVCLCAVGALAVRAGQDAKLQAKDIHMRDPFVVTDAERGRYLLLSSCFADNGEKPGDAFHFLGTGAKVYESEDLIHFKPARMVLEISGELDCRAFWAPEMHRYRDKWYIFGTINYGTPRMKSARGTWTFVADGPEGPFRPASKRPIPPEDWFTLDGTLWVEDGKPHMVFCHEWIQIGVGEMCEVEMTDDLSAPVGEPRTLFRATDYLANPPKEQRESVVTDGPFLYRSPKSGKLFMTWSNVGQKGAYLVILSESASGRLAGPWGKHRVIFDTDGGHGMIFRRLDGSLAFALHSPNATSQERPKFLDVVDTGDTLEIVQ